MKKNILVRSLYKIKSPQWFADRSSEGDLYSQYMDMSKISLETFEKHLAGDWEYVFFNKEVENIQEVFKDHFFELYELWKKGHNILYCGPDNFVKKPVEVFGKYEDFMMFNYTDPKSSIEPNHYNIQHEHFFNADVRYFPQSMDQEIWNIGLEMAQNWDFDCWNTEQFILNHMLWQQPNRTLENTIDPTMAYQGHMLYPTTSHKDLATSDKWNNCEFADAKIVHIHGSRNAPEKLSLMNVWKKYYGI